MLFICELKKIWRPWLILVIGIIFYGYYVTNMRYEIGFYNSEIHGLYFKALAGRYGTTLEEDEIAQMREELAAIGAERDAYVASYPPCVREGISTFDEAAAAVMSFSGKTEGLTAQEWNQLVYDLDTEKGNWADSRYYAVYENVYAYDDFRENLDTKEAFAARLRDYSERHWNGRFNGDVQKTADLFYKEKNHYAIMRSPITLAATRVFANLLVLDVTAVLILVLPVLVRDRRTRVRALQWASKTGRGICPRQLGAVLFTAAIVTAGCLILAFLVLEKRGDLVFWNTPVNGNWCNTLNLLNIRPMVNCTYGGFCLLLCIPFAAVSLSCAALAFALSKVSRNVFFMLIWGIAAAFLLTRASMEMEFYALLYGDIPGILSRSPWQKIAAAAVTALLAAAAGAAVILRTRKEQA